MRVAGHLYGGAALFKKLKIGENITLGAPTAWDTNNQAGISMPAAASDVTDTLGLAEDTGTYATTQNSAGTAEGLITVDVRADAIVSARMSGGATTGTALTTIQETSGETAGTTITDTDVQANDMDGGTVWRLLHAGPPGVGGESRQITTHTGSTSLVVTVPFTQDVVLNDRFLMCPWSLVGDGTAGEDGSGDLSTTTDFLEADATVASGTGAEVSVLDLLLNGPSDSYVLFLFSDHVHRVSTL